MLDMWGGHVHGLMKFEGCEEFNHVSQWGQNGCTTPQKFVIKIHEKIKPANLL